MAFVTGDLVRIKVLDNRVGRVVGSQMTGHSRVLLYLVRYEVGAGPEQRSESSLYVERELAKAA